MNSLTNYSDVVGQESTLDGNGQNGTVIGSVIAVGIAVVEAHDLTEADTKLGRHIGKDLVHHLGRLDSALAGRAERELDGIAPLGRCNVGVGGVVAQIVQQRVQGDVELVLGDDGECVARDRRVDVWPADDAGGGGLEIPEETRVVAVRVIISGGRDDQFPALHNVFRINQAAGPSNVTNAPISGGGDGEDCVVDLDGVGIIPRLCKECQLLICSL